MLNSWLKNLLPNKQVVTGVEVGTSEVRCVVGEIQNGFQFRFLGIGKCRTDKYKSGVIKKGEIIDIDNACRCVRDAICEAEEFSGIEVGDVCVGITGRSVGNTDGVGYRRVEKTEVSPVDKQEVYESARNAATKRLSPVSQVYFLHWSLQPYIVDSKDEVADPINLTCSDIKLPVHGIYCLKTENGQYFKLHKTITETGRNVEYTVFTGFASSRLILGGSEFRGKRSGCLIIDIGAGTTEFVYAIDQSVVYADLIAVGGNHITNDIALVMNMPFFTADWLKKEMGSARADRSLKGKIVSYQTENSKTEEQVEQYFLQLIMEKRLAELFRIIREKIKDKEKSGVFRLAKENSVVLIGGGANIPGIQELAENVFGFQSIPYTPRQAILDVNQEEERQRILKVPEYATAMGLAYYQCLVNSQKIKSK